MDKLNIEYFGIDEIKPYERNAKQHPREQIEQIKNSIMEFGFNDPIAIWHGEIVEGHGRYVAATELGIQFVPVIRLDGLTDEQRRAYALAHNKLTMNSGFDIDLLDEELSSIADIDMGVFSFLEDETYFDPDAEYTPQEKGEVIITVEPWQAEEIKSWLDERLIDYKESYAR